MSIAIFNVELTSVTKCLLRELNYYTYLKKKDIAALVIVAPILKLINQAYYYLK